MKKILLLIVCGMLHASMHAQSWNITGNTGTNSQTNFIGTTDKQALIFKTNNAERVRILTNGNIGIGATSPLQKLHVKGNINIDSGFAIYIANHPVLRIDSISGNTFLGNGVGIINTGKFNTITGFQSLHSNTTGAHNIANGYKALYSNTLGYYNMAIGSFALYHNTNGNQNIADGYEALYTNTNGNSNIAIGHFALGSSSTASFNIGIGEHALFHTTTGFSNTANGAWALYYNTAGGLNVATGASALYNNTTGSYNTANGASSLYYNTTGSNNTANGYNALLFNTTGSNNTANGWQVLFNNTTGIDNTAIGVQALFSNTTGMINTANGLQALYSNTTGNNNTANGYQALYSNTTGGLNTADGASALLHNTTGIQNTADGASALLYNNTGSDNTASGYKAIMHNTTGSSNTAIGNYSLTDNTTGNFNTASGYSSLGTNVTGNYNLAIGAYALNKNVAGNNNTAFGTYALQNATGSNNTGIGQSSLAANTTGEENIAVGAYTLPYDIDSWDNTALGFNAGLNLFGRNGWNNTFIGSYTEAVYDGTYNSTAIGNKAIVGSSNQVRIGNDFVTSIGGYANWTNISDGRVKKNMKANVPGLAFINKLKPLTYNLDLDAIEKITQQFTMKDKDGKQLTLKKTQAELTARNAKQQILYTGFVAQDVEKAAKELNYDFSGVDAAKSDKDLYGLRYAEFVVPLVKAVQELSNDNDSLKSTLADVVTQVAVLKKQIDELKLGNTLTGAQHPISDAGRLEQNAPNPFNNKTIIHYYIPSAAGYSSLTINNVNGQTLKTISLNNKGAGETTISAGELFAGIYFYALIIDGRKVDTKQMVLTK